MKLDDTWIERLLEKLTDTNARTVFFPVRHHSPACARLVGELIREMRPESILIEGPSDFNERFQDLYLDHELPIAIYSYFQLADQRLGAYYPFCEYSPEWQAIRAGRRSSTDAAQAAAHVQFIDLPWREVAPLDTVAHRYADREMRDSGYVALLCQKMGVDTFDDLWDRMVEIDGRLSLPEYLRRAHRFCLQLRSWEERAQLSDRMREAFMVERIQETLEQREGRVLVVTGGYHSSALAAQLYDVPWPGEPNEDTEDAEESADKAPSLEDVVREAMETAHSGEASSHHGIALTPYSYARLDSLAGYEAGMPSPGFYNYVWQARSTGSPVSHLDLLQRVVKMLRERKQTASTADLIAVETMARALAAIRGHEQEGEPLVWRGDLLDAVTSALVKEEVSWDSGSPFLDAVLEVFRGDRRGRLAPDSPRSPLTTEIQQQLEQSQLEPSTKRRELTLDLFQPDDREKSRLLHRLSILEIAGFRLVDTTDLQMRDDLSEIREVWRIHWSPDFDATCVEASRYGTGLADASSARLQEQAARDERSAEAAARLLFQASLAGLEVLTPRLITRLTELIREEGDFVAAGSALGHLVHLYVYDEALGTAGQNVFTSLLHDAFTRSVWLLESMGNAAGREKDTLAAIAALLEAFERCEASLELNREEFLGVLHRIEQQAEQSAAVRGAAVGCLWSLGDAAADQVQQHLQLFAHRAEHVGDFLSGLFYMAREVAQRHPELVRGIDAAVQAMSDDEFLAAVPALRLAFTYFTPREKHYMLTTLFESLGMRRGDVLATLEVDSGTAARAMHYESQLFAAAKRFGVRPANQARNSSDDE